MDEHRAKDPSFSLYEFRSWLAKQGKEKIRRKKPHSPMAENMVGKEVESRLGLKRLVEKITQHNQSDIADILAEDFKSNGGKITEVTGENLLVKIEVESGSFLLPKIYTKYAEDQ